MGAMLGVIPTGDDSAAAAATDGIARHGPVLLVLRNGAVHQPAVDLARTLAAGGDPDLEVLDAVRVARAAPLALPRERIEDHRRTTRGVVRSIREADPDLAVDGRVTVGHDIARIVADAAESGRVGTVVVDGSWRRSGRPRLSGSPFAALRKEVVAPVAVPGSGSFPETVSSVLVPVAGGVHTAAVLDVARDVAGARDAWIDLLCVVPPGESSARRAGAELLEASESRLAPYEKVDTWLLEADGVAEAIVDQSRYYGLTVIGGPRTPRLRRAVFGSTSRRVRDGSMSSVVTAWAPTGGSP